MPRRAPPKPLKLTIALTGEGITPKDVSLRQLAELLDATAGTFDSLAAERRVNPPTVSLAKVKEGSAAYELYSSDRQADRVAASFVTAVRRRGKGSSPRTRKSLERMHRVSTQTGALRIDPIHPSPKAKPLYLAAPLKEEATQLEEATVVYGRVVGLRIDVRDKAVVTLRYDDGGQGDFEASPEMLQTAAGLLGRSVAAKVTFLRGDEQDWEGEIEEIEERAGAGHFMETIKRARRELQEKGIVIDASTWVVDSDDE
jgi:hypothetical protein